MMGRGANISLYCSPGTWLRLLGSPMATSEARGEGFLLSIALTIVLVGEAALCLLIIMRVSYTEIDWLAYMQEVQGFLGGEFNYYNLRGDTGPLVYPAGFVYIYSALHWLTDSGRNIVAAQLIFVGIYVSLVFWVLIIYRKAGANSVPLWATLLVCVSKRVHSIFVLRLFNDGVAMWLLYGATYAFLCGRWRAGSAVYSLAVGVKMNILLFAPGLLLLLLQANGLSGAIVCLAICGSVQLVLGAPFLWRFPSAYLRRSFELGRAFQYRWTVNFKFLSEEVFLSWQLSAFLLLLTVVALGLFAWKWLRQESPRRPCIRIKVRQCLEDQDGDTRSRGVALMPMYVAKTLFTSNFIGIVFCRSLHYQFYCWYYHTLPFLLWSTNLPLVLRLSVMMGVELGFNVFPATPMSSAVLQACHVLLLAALWVAPVVPLGRVSSAEKKVE
ncbi:unnamed protein product [Choristocarpus tenellus]